MRIGNGFSLAQLAELDPRKTTAHRSAKAAKTDAVSVAMFGAEARAADMDVRAAQNTMTLFRIAESSLARMESSFVRMSELAGDIEAGVLSSAEINTAAVEASALSSVVSGASDAKMAGVPLFGNGKETEAMWGVAAGNAAALAESDYDQIASVATINDKIAAAAAARITDQGAARKFYDAAAAAGAARETMTREAALMGDAAIDLARDAIESFAAAAARPAGASARGLAAFAAEHADYAVDTIGE